MTARPDCRCRIKRPAVFGSASGRFSQRVTESVRNGLPAFGIGLYSYSTRGSALEKGMRLTTSGLSLGTTLLGLVLFSCDELPEEEASRAPSPMELSSGADAALPVAAPRLAEVVINEVLYLPK